MEVCTFLLDTILKGSFVGKTRSVTLDCPVAYTLAVLEGKWKLMCIHVLSEDGVLRYGELKRRLQGITHKMLSQHLKELEADGLINRQSYHQVPPKVEYSLTEKGRTLVPILELMCQWGNANRPAAEPDAA